MMKQLSQMELIEKERYSFLSMTEAGRTVAEKYLKVYRNINELLCGALGIPPGCAEKGALETLSSMDTDRLDGICCPINKDK